MKECVCCPFEELIDIDVKREANIGFKGRTNAQAGGRHLESLIQGSIAIYTM